MCMSKQRCRSERRRKGERIKGNLLKGALWSMLYSEVGGYLCYYTDLLHYRFYEVVVSRAQILLILFGKKKTNVVAAFLNRELRESYEMHEISFCD